MASTATLAIAAAGASAAITFGLVSIVSPASSRPDLGGPVVVEPLSEASGEPRVPEGVTDGAAESPAVQPQPEMAPPPDPRTAVPPADPAAPDTVGSHDDDGDDDDGADDDDDAEDGDD